MTSDTPNKQSNQILSGVKNAEHAPLWDFPEKDILPEEIQIKFWNIIRRKAGYMKWKEQTYHSPRTFDESDMQQASCFNVEKI